jgi:hypothetical protein
MAHAATGERARILALLRAAARRSHVVRVLALAALALSAPLLMVSPLALLWLMGLGVLIAASNTRHRLASSAAARLASPSGEYSLDGPRLLVRDRAGRTAYWLGVRERRVVRRPKTARVPTARALPPR